MGTSGVDITANHIDIARNVAGRIARTTTMGRLAGADELFSEALVLLVEIAAEFDPDRGVFEPFLITRLQFRLTDYLRATYGRSGEHEEGPSAKQRFHLRMTSLDELALDQDGDRPADRYAEQPTPGPTVEEQVEARDELRRLGAFLRTTSERKRDALLAPVVEGGWDTYREKHGQGPGVRGASMRFIAKQQAYEALGREPEVRSYVRTVADQDGVVRCSVPGCGRVARVRGWCGAHNTRWVAHGDVLAHVPIGTPGKRIPKSALTCGPENGPLLDRVPTQRVSPEP